MADLKISQLNAITVLTPATDVLPVVDSGGVTKKITTNQILGSGGTATLASATITGALTVDTTTLVVNAAGYADRVGIGTATPATRFVVSGGRTGLFSADAFSLALAQTSGQANYAYLGTDASGNLLFSESSGSVIMTLSQSGNLALANGNLVMTTSGKGIDFSAVTGGTGTATANVLNDYEEGTWTGTLKGSVSDPTTAVTATGKYTKIGRQVSIQISFISVDTTVASGRILVTGLPFAASSSPNGITGSVLIDAMATFTGSPGVYMTSSSTQIDLYSSVSNGAIASVTHNAGAAKSLWLNVTYTV